MSARRASACSSHQLSHRELDKEFSTSHDKKELDRESESETSMQDDKESYPSVKYLNKDIEDTEITDIN